MERKEIGFPVDDKETIPAIGATGVSTQMLCPLIKGACMKNHCMFWVELLTGEGKRVAHCAYYWTTIQLVDIKTALVSLERKLESVRQDATPKP